MNWSCSDHVTAEISSTTEKSPGELRRLVTQSSGKNYRLLRAWKTRNNNDNDKSDNTDMKNSKGVNNNNNNNKNWSGKLNLF